MNSLKAFSPIVLGILSTCPWVFILNVFPTSAQPITPDGATPTDITQNGNQIDISGGTIAGQNQFHSVSIHKEGSKDG